MVLEANIENELTTNEKKYSLKQVIEHLINAILTHIYIYKEREENQ